MSSRITLAPTGIAAIAVLAMTVAVGACTPTAGESNAPSGSATPIVLREAPADLGCDAIGTPYRSLTIRIDAAATDPVWAESDTGARLGTFWSPGFVGGTSADPVVRDAGGAVVATDGEVITIPEAGWPRLHGYFVCVGLDDLYVLAQDPQ